MNYYTAHQLKVVAEVADQVCYPAGFQWRICGRNEYSWDDDFGHVILIRLEEGGQARVTLDGSFVAGFDPKPLFPGLVVDTVVSALREAVVRARTLAPPAEAR